MTTTAEKIKIMQAFEDGEEVEFKQIGDIWRICSRTPAWAWDATEYRIKPSEPEPLECWGVFNSEGKLIQFSQKELCACPGGCKIVRMREVTPAVRKDREDAEKWRTKFGDIQRQIDEDRWDAEKYRQWAKFVGEEGLEETLKNAARYRYILDHLGKAVDNPITIRKIRIWRSSELSRVIDAAREEKAR